jgi:SAM-dependent methyltransferase
MLLVIILIFVLLFGLVVFFGPPYLPTLKAQTGTALDLLQLKPGQTLLELGSGDGRVMRAAAARGLKVVGIELNPVLVFVSRVVTWRYRDRVRIVWGSYWQARWPKEADGIFTFMIGRQMSKLDHHIVAWHQKPVRLASFAFTIPGKQPLKEKKGIFLYAYK